jgi:phosphodiesterase/alkaline phosphatase D-like protein
VCPDPWIGTASLTGDGWAGYAPERTEIANFIRDNHINNLAILAGDMHGLAFDDGTFANSACAGRRAGLLCASL